MIEKGDFYIQGQAQPLAIFATEFALQRLPDKGEENALERKNLESTTTPRDKPSRNKLFRAASRAQSISTLPIFPLICTTYNVLKLDAI